MYIECSVEYPTVLGLRLNATRKCHCMNRLTNLLEQETMEVIFSISVCDSIHSIKYNCRFQSFVYI